MVGKSPTVKSIFLVFATHCWMMDLGQDQQQHSTVHSGGVSQVPFRSPSNHLPLASAHLPFPFPLETWKLGNLKTWRLVNFKIGKSETQALSTFLNSFPLFSVFSLFSTVLNSFQPFSDIFNCNEPFSDIFYPFKLFSAIITCFQLFSTVLSHFTMFSPILNCFQPFSTVLICFQPII